MRSMWTLCCALWTSCARRWLRVACRSWCAWALRCLVLAALHAELGFGQLLSHEETGPGWSYRRDVLVGRWCQAHHVAWQEFTQTGVVRSLRSRSGWAGRWQARMDAPLHLLQGGYAAAAPLDQPALPTLAELGYVRRTANSYRPPAKKPLVALCRHFWPSAVTTTANRSPAR